MINARIVLHVRPEKRAEFLSTMNGIMDHALRRSGCVGCRLTADCDDAESYIMMSDWDGTSSFNEFLRSKEMIVLNGMRGLLDADPRSIIDEVRNRRDSTLKSMRDQ